VEYDEDPELVGWKNHPTKGWAGIVNKYFLTSSPIAGHNSTRISVGG